MVSILVSPRVQVDPDGLAAGEMVPSDRRIAFGSNALAIAVNQRMQLNFFTAARTETISSIEEYSGGTAAGATPTLVRFGVYSIAANGDGTLVASTPNDTTLFATINTAYNKALSVAWAKVAGQRYAIGTLVVTGAALPSFHCVNVAATAVPNAALALAPRISGHITGVADLPGSFLAASVVADRMQISARLVP